jgi:hypothetical protein
MWIFSTVPEELFAEFQYSKKASDKKLGHLGKKAGKTQLLTYVSGVKKQWVNGSKRSIKASEKYTPEFAMLFSWVLQQLFLPLCTDELD